LANDLLIDRLDCLREEDLHAVLTGGLRIPEKKLLGLEHPDLVTRCSLELRAAAGSSTRNLVRKAHQFPYKQMLIDVADKLQPGITPLSWTSFRLHDEHPEEEVEQRIMDLFEEQVRKWWSKLSEAKRGQFVEGLNEVLRADAGLNKPLGKGMTPFIQKQAMEQLVQAGLIAGLAKTSAGGLLGVAGVSLIGHLGWLILLQTVGWMSGIKIAVLGLGGYGALGGAVTWLGSAAVGTVVALPGMIALADGPAYRKTIPSLIMILAKSRINRLTQDE